MYRTHRYLEEARSCLRVMLGEEGMRSVCGGLETRRFAGRLVSGLAYFQRLQQQNASLFERTRDAALLLAVSMNRITLTDFLLEHGAKPTYTAMNLAMRKRFAAVLGCLARHRAKNNF